MIEHEITGNIIDLTKTGKYNGMIQGCNCFCVMGSGLAPQVAKAFPIALKVDNQTIKGDVRKLGKFTSATYSDETVKDVTIVNAYTQYQTGRNGSLRAIERVFKNLDTLYAGCHFLIPLIGCGIAGLDWTQVSSVINRHTPNLKLTLVHYNG